MIFGHKWQKLKNYASYYYYSFRGKPFKNRPPENSFGNPLIVGFLSSPIGIGEGARLIRLGLENAGYDVSIYDLTPVIQPHLSQLTVPAGSPDDGSGPIIIHANPSEVPKTISLLKERGLTHRRMIGIWAWELEKIPKFWLSCQDWFDEIWSISKFSLDSFSELSIPINHVGYPVIKSENAATEYWRERLKLNGVFSVLMAFDAQSSSNRKNPIAGIKAFQKAFPNKSKATLVIKITGDYNRLIDTQPDLFSETNILIIDDVLTRKEMINLIRSCDCFLSLSRAEGFGLSIAQAGVNGVPTIVTGWSAPADWKGCPGIYFVDFELVPINDNSGIYNKAMGCWANPRIGHAAKLLQDVSNLSSTERIKISEDAYIWWSENYGYNSFNNRLSGPTLKTMKKPTQ